MVLATHPHLVLRWSRAIPLFSPRSFMAFSRMNFKFLPSCRFEASYYWSLKWRVWRTQECVTKFLHCGCKETDLVWFLRYMNILSPWCYRHLWRSAIGSVGRKPVAKHIFTIRRSDVFTVHQQHSIEASFVSRLCIIGLDLNVCR